MIVESGPNAGQEGGCACSYCQSHALCTCCGGVPSGYYGPPVVCTPIYDEDLGRFLTQEEAQLQIFGEVSADPRIAAKRARDN